MEVQWMTNENYMSIKTMETLNDLLFFLTI